VFVCIPPGKAVTEMTHTVLGGTLNSTHPLTHSLTLMSAQTAYDLWQNISPMQCLLTAILNVKNVMSFSSHMAHRVALISVFSALSQTPVYTVRPRIHGWCIARCACLRRSFRWYSLRLPTEEWPGWVDLGGWLHTRLLTVTQPDSALINFIDAINDITN